MFICTPGLTPRGPRGQAQERSYLHFTEEAEVKCLAHVHERREMKSELEQRLFGQDQCCSPSTIEGPHSFFSRIYRKPCLL